MIIIELGRFDQINQMGLSLNFLMNFVVIIYFSLKYFIRVNFNPRLHICQQLLHFFVIIVITTSSISIVELIAV